MKLVYKNAPRIILNRSGSSGPTPPPTYTEVWGESPTITHNSPTVTLAHLPLNTNEVKVFYNGVRQKYTSDYTISGSIITFTFDLLNIPGQTDEVLCDYRY